MTIEYWLWFIGIAVIIVVAIKLLVKYADKLNWLWGAAFTGGAGWRSKVSTWPGKVARFAVGLAAILIVSMFLIGVSKALLKDMKAWNTAIWGESKKKKEPLTPAQLLEVKAEMTNWRRNLLDSALTGGWKEKIDDTYIRLEITKDSYEVAYSGLNVVFLEKPLQWHVDGIHNPDWDTWKMDYDIDIRSSPWKHDSASGFSIPEHGGISGKMPLTTLTKLFFHTRKRGSGSPNRAFPVKVWNPKRNDVNFVRLAFSQVLKEKREAPCVTLPAQCAWQLYLCFAYPSAAGKDMPGINLPVEALKWPVNAEGLRPGLILHGLSSGKVEVIDSVEANDLGEIIISSLDNRFLSGDQSFIPKEAFRVHVIAPDAPGELSEVEAEVVIRLDPPEAITSQIH